MEVSFLQKGSLHGPALGSINQIGKGLSGLSSQSKNVGDSIGANLAKGIGMFLAADAIKSGLTSVFEAVKYGIVGINAEVEQMSITMATMFTANGNTRNFQYGLGASMELMKMMRMDAAALPGDFQDLSNVMMRLTNPALKAGLSIRETEQLAANAMAVGVGSGMKADVVGREIGMMIEGNMRHNLALLRVLPNFHMAPKDFNALSREQRVETIQKSLGMRGGQEAAAITEMKDAFQTSWIGLTSTLKEKFKMLFGDMGYYLGDRLKDAMSRFLEWFNGNSDKITHWAKMVGWHLANGFTALEIQFRKLEPYLLKFGRFLNKEAQENHLGRDLGMVVGGAAGLKAASMVAPMLPGAMSLGGATLEGFGGLAASLGEATVGAAGLGSMLTGVGEILLVVAAVGAAVYGAFEGIANAGTPLHETMVALWEGIKSSFGGAAQSLGHAFATAEPALRRISEVMGGAMLALLEMFANLVELLANALDAAVTKIANSWDTIKGLIDKATFGTITPLLEADKKISKYLIKPEEEYHPHSDLDKKVKTPEVVNHTTHIHKVDINVNSNQDPSRVAQLTADRLLDIARHPRVSRYSPQNMILRPQNG